MIKNSLFFTIHYKNGVLLLSFNSKWPYPESDQSTGNLQTVYIFNDVNLIHKPIKHSMSKPCCIVNTIVSAHIHDVVTPPIDTSWIYVISLTFFIQPQSRNFSSKFLSEWVMIQLAINCLVSYFLDLISRSWSAFVECDRPIRITWSYLRRSRAGRFWNQALDVAFKAPVPQSHKE